MCRIKDEYEVADVLIDPTIIFLFLFACLSVYSRTFTISNFYLPQKL